MIRSAAKAIVIRNGNVLLNRCVGFRGDVYYDLPGGGQKEFETLEETLVRECLEETGYRVRPVRFAALVEEIYDDEELRRRYADYAHRILHIFIAELVDDAVHEATEMDFQQEECQWISVDDIPSMNVRPNPLSRRFREIVASATPVYLGTVRFV
ncbi:MAG: NUDIX domain-containing protein [Bacillota bacterium]